MFYPKSYDITPLTITRGTISYDGITEATTLSTNVRMILKKTYTKDQFGNLIIGNGTFYKYGELDILYGDNFTFENIEYTCNSVYKARLENGGIEYTRVTF